MNRNLGLWIAVVLLFGLYVYWYSANINPTINIPSPKMPAPNSFDDFNAAAGMIRDKSIFDRDPPDLSHPPKLVPAGSPGSLPLTTPQENDQVVADNAPLVDRLQMGFSHQYQPPTIRSSRTPQRYFSTFREMARLLVFEGRAAALKGDWSEAAGFDADALELGSEIGRGDLISKLVGDAIGSMAQRDLWTTIDHLIPSENISLAKRIDMMQTQREPYAHSLLEDKWEQEAILLETLRSSHGADDLISMSRDGSSSGNTKVPSYLFYLVYPKRLIMAHYGSYMDAQVARGKKPYYDTRREAPPSIPADPYCELYSFLDKVRFRDVMDDAYTQLLITMLALRAYELDHSGAYPDTLQQLVPRYLHAVPYDPFAPTDAPLKYRRTGSEYLLYSVGADGVDDGGKPFLNKKPATPTNRWEEIDTKGDIVAGINED